MGVELVEGRDLECRRGKVYMRTTEGLRRVDVIYRRLDDDFMDPVHFRSDSMLGVPGIVNAVRDRRGSARQRHRQRGRRRQADLHLCSGPDPLLPARRTDHPQHRHLAAGGGRGPEEVLDRLDELVVKPVDGSGGKGIVIGPRATRDELDALRRRVIADPRGWIAQPLVQLSTVPTFINDTLAPRHVDLRPFAVNTGEDVYVLPGGLTRVALPEGELVVNSSQGGGSKDTWVLSSPLHHPPRDDDEAEETEPEVDELGGDDGVPEPEPKPTPRRQPVVPMVISRPPGLAPDLVRRGEPQQEQQQQLGAQRQVQRASAVEQRQC